MRYLQRVCSVLGLQVVSVVEQPRLLDAFSSCETIEASDDSSLDLNEHDNAQIPLDFDSYLNVDSSREQMVKMLRTNPLFVRVAPSVRTGQPFCFVEFTFLRRPFICSVRMQTFWTCVEGSMSYGRFV